MAAFLTICPCHLAQGLVSAGCTERKRKNEADKFSWYLCSKTGNGVKLETKLLQNGLIEQF